MQTITTIGFDIAKSVFQVHGVDASGRVVIRRQLKRRSVLAFFQKLPPCLVGIEACASSHYHHAGCPARSRLRRKRDGIPVSFTLDHHGPGHPRNFVSKRDGGDYSSAVFMV